MRFPEIYWNLSDEEVVELSRKRMRRTKRLRRPRILGGIMIAMVLVMITLAMLKTHLNLYLVPAEHSEVYYGAIGGLFLGMLPGMLLGAFGVFYSRLLEGERRDELLTKTWDELKAKERSTKNVESPKSPPSASAKS